MASKQKDEGDSRERQVGHRAHGGFDEAGKEPKRVQPGHDRVVAVVGVQPQRAERAGPVRARNAPLQRLGQPIAAVAQLVVGLGWRPRRPRRPNNLDHFCGNFSSCESIVWVCAR